VGRTISTCFFFLYLGGWFHPIPQKTQKLEQQIYCITWAFFNSNNAWVLTISMNWMLYRAINNDKGNPFNLKFICYIYKIRVEPLTNFLILREQNTFINAANFIVEFEHLLDNKGLNVCQNAFSLSSFLGSRFL